MKRNSLSRKPRRKLAALQAAAALGDSVVFLLFAAAGEGAHRDAGGYVSTIKVAAPFLVGWFAAAIPLGAFGAEAFRSRRFALVSVVRSWLGGCALAMAIRSGLEGHLMPPAFVAIAFTFNAVLLSLWRELLLTVSGFALRGGRSSSMRRSRAPTR